MLAAWYLSLKSDYIVMEAKIVLEVIGCLTEVVNVLSRESRLHREREKDNGRYQHRPY